MAAQRPFITCHVLDTVSGKPAADISVKLELIYPANATATDWTARTNNDGRVPAWTSNTDLNELVASMKSKLNDDDQMIWKLTFDTGAYFGARETGEDVRKMTYSMIEAESQRPSTHCKREPT
ncbi:hypothetical protein LTR74_005292 [Friedmanniomyces endolithicus]|nr:hypothetical protein LTR74_005292 [Friedmanniomyces endolithicus]